MSRVNAGVGKVDIALGRWKMSTASDHDVIAVDACAAGATGAPVVGMRGAAALASAAGALGGYCVVKTAALDQMPADAAAGVVFPLTSAQGAGSAPLAAVHPAGAVQGTGPAMSAVASAAVAAVRASEAVAGVVAAPRLTVWR